MLSKIDLHTHTNASDGTDPPLELVRRALESGVSLFAITDHDTVTGAREVLPCVPEGVRFITGVEFSCRAAHGGLHILGLGCDFDAPDFKRLSEKSTALRRSKLERRIEFIKESGYAIPEEEFETLRAMPAAGKPHFGELLTRYGCARDIESAIRGIVDRCDTDSERLDAEETIRGIRAAGGAAVWAHPMGEEGKRELSDAELRDTLGELADDGIMAMECWYSKYTVRRCIYLEKLAMRSHLRVSGGSDYHGSRKSAALGQLNCEGVPVGIERLTVLELIN